MRRKTTFNGYTLDDEVPGFHTLDVSGRAFHGVETDSSDNVGDGAMLLAKRIPEREIEVTFYISQTADDMTGSLHTLMRILNSSTAARLEFSDEPEVYYQKVAYTGPDQDMNWPHLKSGSLAFTCYDPYAYAVDTKTVSAEAVDGILTAKLTNEGNVAVPIDYEITMNSDNGYIGILSEDGKTMQYGSIEEADGEEYKENETLVTLDDFFSAADDTTGTDYMHPQYGAKGTLTTRTWFDTKFLAFGTKGETVGSANGGLRTITIPADSSGAVGAVNWYSYQHILLWASKMGQTGEMCINFLTDDNTVIAGLNWYKTDMSGNTGYYEMWANGKTVRSRLSYTCSHLNTQNPWYWSWGHCDVRKVGADVTFFWWGQYFTFHVPEIENLVCTKIQIAIKAWGDRTTVGSNFLEMLGVNNFYFQKLGVDKWADVPNRYSTGDVLTIEGDSTKVYLNGQNRVGDEILGSTYFQAQPGDNTIEIYNSSWAKDVTAKATIREAWV